MHDLSTGAQQVLDALTEIGQGTVAEIRDKTGKSARVTDKAIKELTEAGLITETDPGDGNPASWTITSPAAESNAVTDDQPGTATEAQPEAADDQPNADIGAVQDETVELGDGNPAVADLGDSSQLDGPAEDNAAEDDSAQDAANAIDEDTTDDGSGAPADDTADKTEQMPARPKPPADRRVLAVAGVLGDYPEGATIDEIAEATGYKYGAVALLLQAMEQADAARRIPEDTETGTPERWQPGPGKAIDVDPNPAPPRCPTCHQVIRNSTPKAATATPRTSGTSGGTVNSDGNEPLGRGVLSAWTEEFINANPGHEFTPGTIAEALGAQHGRTISSGAVLNNCRTLAMNGQVTVVRQQPFTVTANKPTAADTTDSTTDSGSEQQ